MIANDGLETQTTTPEFRETLFNLAHRLESTTDPMELDYLELEADRIERSVGQQVPPEAWMVRGATW